MSAINQPIEAAHQLIGLGTFEQLARMDAQGHPILSIYLDLDPSRYPTPDSRRTQLGAVLDDARRQDGDREADLVEARLRANPEISRDARALAIFCSAAIGVFEVVRLSEAVEPLAVVDAIPWLEPLAATVSTGDWGVAVVSRRAARLFRGDSAGLTEFASITDDLHGRHAQGGWSQARFARGIEEQVAAHVRGVAERLLRAHQRRRFHELVIVCSDELRPVVEHALPGELANVLAGMVHADLERASVYEISGAVSPLIERVERERERDLIARLEHALGTGGRAAAGLDEVLSVLEQQRVEILVVGELGTMKAGLCPTCGRLLTDDGRKCPVDGAALTDVDAGEYAIDAAASQSTRVVVARYEQAWLHEHGEIAALLRW